MHAVAIEAGAELRRTSACPAARGPARTAPKSVLSSRLRGRAAEVEPARQRAVRAPDQHRRLALVPRARVQQVDAGLEQVQAAGAMRDARTTIRSTDRSSVVAVLPVEEVAERRLRQQLHRRAPCGITSVL